ncbi:MAG TPA: UvrD-helicase domain-containing protein [Thermomicrobiales bacterium]|nr:UvrD-helicase domain-containing protein [Thermomicrobiales bacterium]
MEFILAHRKTFISTLRALPDRARAQVVDKLEVLCRDPAPDGTNVKIKLKDRDDIYRLRVGDYRVLYMYGDGVVQLLVVDKRKEDTYKKTPHVAELPDRLPAIARQLIAGLSDADEPADSADEQDELAASTPVEDVWLGTEISKDLLLRLGVPEAYFSELLACRTLNDLCAAKIPEDLRSTIFDNVADLEYEQITQQPSFITGDAINLLRAAQGDLVPFLLRLSEEQERLVYWSLNRKGPTLVKGGPGTGKSTIALYRIQGVVKQYQHKSLPLPRILFTTYTNALVRYSQQLLQSLLGDDASCVTVATADSILLGIVAGNQGRQPRIIDPTVEPQRLEEARQLARDRAEASGQPAQRLFRSINGLTYEYIREEFGQVIEARQLADLDSYLAEGRIGRRVGLSETQRQALWLIYEAYCQVLRSRDQITWHQMRRKAAELLQSHADIERYDAVVIDEVQDLDASALRALVSLCKTPNRIFLAADANQSIYGNGFRWVDVHESLRFQGRTAVLRTNYRSTREIGQAAHAYLGNGALEEDTHDDIYALSGPKPTVIHVANVSEEASSLTRVLLGSARDLRVGLNACAVLVPSSRAARAIADRLQRIGLDATAMTSKNLSLMRFTVKVLPFKASKGLEFPIVAIAGFFDEPASEYVDQLEDAEARELAEADRRVLYVAMTRAMRSLHVVIPASDESSLLQGVDLRYWAEYQRRDS